MRVHSLRSALWIIFSAFAGLVALAVGATFLSIQTQSQDALVINLAGRQRMLLQQIDRLIIQLSMLSSESSGFRNSPGALAKSPVQSLYAQYIQELQSTADQFSTSLDALRNGGNIEYQDNHQVYLPGTKDAHSLDLLASSMADWQNLQGCFKEIYSLQPDAPEYLLALNQIQVAIPDLTARADELVLSYEQSASQKLDRLRWIQFVFLCSSGLVILWGVWLMRRQVFLPLKEIDLQASKIGMGNLNNPVHVSGLAEVEQIGLTMENMRKQLATWNEALESGVKQRTKELEAFTRVSQEIIANLELDQVLKSITDKTRLLLGCEAAFLCLHDADQKNLHLNSASCGENYAGCSYSTCTSARGRISQENAFPAAQVLQGKVVTTNVNGHNLPVCQILDARFQVSHMAAPLYSGDRVIGVLCAGSSQEDFFDEDGRRLLVRLANVASLALANARLYQQAERLAVLEERQYIAAEIHDGFIQTVNTLRLLQDQLEDDLAKIEHEYLPATSILNQMRHAGMQAEREARKAISSLKEDIPAVSPLQDQLSQLVDSLRLPGQSMQFETSLNLPLFAPRQTTEQITRVVKEAITNAQRHACAETIKVSLFLREEMVILEIMDDGVGFDPESPIFADENPHFGLEVMEARAQRIGAGFEIRSQPGDGTIIRLEFPADDLINRGEKDENTHLVSG